jgi:colicin import membrane protein
MNKKLITIESISNNALSVFTGESDALELILKEIEFNARAVVADVNTNKGRDAIRSNAANVAKAKVRIDDAGKTLTAELKELPKKVDASRKAVRDRLDALRDEVRKPLTDWEQEQDRIEQDRVAKIKAEQEAAEIERKYQADWDIALIMNQAFNAEQENKRLKAEQEAAEAEHKYLSDWDIALIMNQAFNAEQENKRLKAEQEAAEAERIAKERAEREEKERAEREERIKQIAIAEEQARQQAAIERAEREKKAAEQAAALAIENARLEKERAEREQAEAIEREKARAKAEADRLQAIEDKRKADTEHRTAVKNAVKVALMSECALTEQQAKEIIKSAIAGKLANLVINF